MLQNNTPKAYAYILFSSSLNKYYIGYTSHPVEVRLERHINEYYGKHKFSAVVKDWVVFLILECETENQARKAEAHIKKMKSKKYIENLKKYPERRERLLNFYRL